MENGKQTVALAEIPDEVVEAPNLDLNQSSFDAIVKFSEQTAKIGKALDETRTFFFKRAFSGDFVSHNGKTVNVSGPGAERILSALGLMGVSWSLTNWEKHKDEGDDANGKWYTHWYSAEGQIGNMRPGRLEGRAGSRDKLFGFKGGKWKDLSDVKEPDIQMAARRCVYKELVRLGLGLRNIPIADAVAMGLDEKKIAKIEFGSEGETKVDASPVGTIVTIKEVKAFAKKDETDKEGKVTKKGWTRYDVIDDKGAKYSTFSESLAEKARGSIGKKCKVAWEQGSKGVEFKGVVAAEDGPDKEPDQEPQG